MPLFDYRCEHCGRVVPDVLCRADDPPPEEPEPCQAPTQAGAPCDFVRVLSTAGQSHRFKSELTSDGLGGWQRQAGGVMVRQRQGE